VGGTAGAADNSKAPVYVGFVNQQGGQQVIGADATTGSQMAVKYINAELDTNPDLAERLYRLLAAYLFDGYPRYSQAETVPLEHHPTLSIMTNMAKRFTMAHEYGHGGIRSLTAENPQSNWNEELQADEFATVATVLSAATLDRIAPELAVGGGVFALACQGLLREAIALVRTGSLPGLDNVEASHPPYDLRVEQIVKTFHRVFHVAYDDEKRRFSLARWMVRKSDSPTTASMEAHIRGALSGANILNSIWRRVQPQLLQDHHNMRPLDKLWA